MMIEGIRLSSCVTSVTIRRSIIRSPRSVRTGIELTTRAAYVSLAIINTTYASSIDLSPEHDGLFVENKESPYVNLIVAREDNVKAENVQNFVKAYQSDEVYQAALEIFKGGAVKGW